MFLAFGFWLLTLVDMSVRLSWYLRLLASTAGVAAVGFLVIASFGQRLPQPAAAIAAASNRPAAAAPAPIDLLIHLPIALVAVIAATRLAGAVFRRLGQPAVVGELTAGILLGPSLFGLLAPDLQAAVFPATVLPSLALLANVCVVLFMFIVGMELDATAMSTGARAALLVSHVGVALPFLMGTGLALGLYSSFAGPVSFDVFSLFVGTSLAITAFPVLARILTDYGIHRTPIGTLALSAAAIGDVAAWCLLAAVVGIARAQSDSGLITTALTVVFIAVMVLLVRPLIVKLAEQPFTVKSGILLLTGLGVSVAIADAIGIHAIFGAFLFGALMPSHSPAAEALTGRIRGAVGLLLPAFFAITGLRTQITLISGATAWWTCLAILAVACAGKFGGSYAAAKMAGLERRDAVALGALMNTRGLVELVVLNVGLSLGVISPALFAMLVLMALVTTASTTPVLWLLGWRPRSPPHPVWTG
jgi:Kef-type K+ transport system membrane component KefB